MGQECAGKVQTALLLLLFCIHKCENNHMAVLTPAVVPVTSVEVTCSEAMLALSFSALLVKCLMKILGRSTLG